MSSHKPEKTLPSRRRFLQGMGLAPVLLRAAPLWGGALAAWPVASAETPSPLKFSDVRLRPHYPSKLPLEDVLRRVPAGSDDYVTEQYATEIESILQYWIEAITAAPRDLSRLTPNLDLDIATSGFEVAKETVLRSRAGIESVKKLYSNKTLRGRKAFVQEFEHYLAPLSLIETAELQIVGIEALADRPLKASVDIRYDIVARRADGRREERVGHWQSEWLRDGSANWRATSWRADEEIVSTVGQPMFMDVTSQALGETTSYREQLLRGADYWRTVLDGASGIDVYGNNGVATGDFDNDGFDDIYVCQPAGLPNRLYRNRGDGTFEDATEKAGVGVLDNTACALFADFRNIGLQDLLVVCGSGPLLFLNQGNGTFVVKHDAFKFERPPMGTFTHAALADYDRDGRLDIYFCLYSYYLGLDQYHYPAPYFDARNGPPNFLMHNEGDGTFTDRTESAKLNVDNDRYSFACAWGDADGNGFPDLYVANDFGRPNLYRNNGDGSFATVSGDAHVEDAGAGMSASWIDFANSGKEDIYSANMWSAAGQRVSQQNIFQQKASPSVRSLYQRHAGGNSLYRNQGDGTFHNVSRQAGVEMGRWSWSSDFWDFDHDGYPDLYVANGYISGPDRNDLGSFFWRQVVGKSPADASPSPAYELGWQALNELIRSDSSWSGYERNVMFANNGDGTFSELSGAVGLDFPDDSRSFALADLDHDGRLEIVLKNRNSPQLRILRNATKELGASIVFRLRGTKSNRDAIGAAITVESGELRQTRYLQAGSGFLSQHSKEVFFGVGERQAAVRATVRWPSGLSQSFDAVPLNHRIEIEEGSANFTVKAFGSLPMSYENVVPPPRLEALPLVVETWLIQPLKAPGFSLPDLNGNPFDLQTLHGNFVLLNFWASTSTSSQKQLDNFRLQWPALSDKLHILAINVDIAEAAQQAKLAAAQARLPFPVLFANEETAGIYNIIYRYLFDRRRDLPIPICFLLDKEGMIIKLYQGPVDPPQLLQDVKSAPQTDADRLRKAIPLGGSLYQSAFQRNDFTYGVAMFRHGYLEQAAESFQQVVAKRPDDPEAYYNLGTLNLRRNDLLQARQYLDRAVKLRPNYPEAWNNLAMLSAQEGDPDTAIRDFQQALQLRPGYATALLNLGNLYRRKGAFEKAQDLLNQALALQPGDPEANYSLGMLYAQQNQVQQAADYLQKAIELRPDYSEALNNLGVLFVREEKYSEAEEQFKNCIRLTPKFEQSYLNLARLYAMRKDKAKAKEEIEELLRLQPQNANAQRALEQLQALP